MEQKFAGRMQSEGLIFSQTSGVNPNLRSKSVSRVSMVKRSYVVYFLTYTCSSIVYRVLHWYSIINLTEEHEANMITLVFESCVCVFVSVCVCV